MPPGSDGGLHTHGNEDETIAVAAMIELLNGGFATPPGWD